MKMTDHNHSICHFYFNFPVFPHTILSNGHDSLEEVIRFLPERHVLPDKIM